MKLYIKNNWYLENIFNNKFAVIFFHPLKYTLVISLFSKENQTQCVYVFPKHIESQTHRIYFSLCIKSVYIFPPLYCKRMFLLFILKAYLFFPFILKAYIFFPFILITHIFFSLYIETVYIFPLYIEGVYIFQLFYRKQDPVPRIKKSGGTKCN